jgi:hypothetical protein
MSRGYKVEGRKSSRLQLTRRSDDLPNEGVYDMIVYTTDGFRWTVRLEPTERCSLLVQRCDWPKERPALAIFPKGKDEFGKLTVDRLELLKEVHANDIFRGHGPDTVAEAKATIDRHGKYVAGYNRNGNRCIRIIIETVRRDMLIVARKKRYSDGTIRDGFVSKPIYVIEYEDDDGLDRPKSRR